MGGTFERERFVEECLKAAKETQPQKAVKEVLRSAVSDYDSTLQVLGDPTHAGLDVLHSSPDLTIFAASWAPHMCLLPHNHKMWALIGIYTGREDNIFWRRGPDRLTAFSANVLFAGDVAELPEEVIHSVTNPLPKFTGGIHIYGGDYFGAQRSQWDPETLREEPSDGASIRAIFEEENRRLTAHCV